MNNTSAIADGAVTIDNGPVLSGTLTIETEMIDVTLGVKTEPDMKWTYVDRAGHFHAWSNDGKLPTLDSRTEHVECGCGGCEEWECEGYDRTVYFCAICGETIEPRTVSHTPTAREYAPGLTTWRVEVAGQVEPDRRVSVKFAAGEQTFFGVGLVGHPTIEGDMHGVRYSTPIVGAGPLGRRGQRKRTKAAA